MRGSFVRDANCMGAVGAAFRGETRGGRLTGVDESCGGSCRRLSRSEEGGRGANAGELLGVVLLQGLKGLLRLLSQAVVFAQETLLLGLAGHLEVQ